MSNLDDLFKKPYLPSQKRKSDAVRNPDEIYKSTKLNGSGPQSARSNGQPTIEDEAGGDEAGYAGPEMPPDLEEEEEEPNDEEGRFFGGGVGGQTVAAMNFLEQRDGGDGVKAEKIDSAWLKKTALNFEKRISKNAELRARYEATPEKFIESEADLDADMKSLSILSEHPELYAGFAELGCIGSLVSLLAHENADIAIDAIEIIGELIDEDVDADVDQWNAIVDAMLEADLLDLLAQSLARFDETAGPEDINGVYHVLGVLESLSSRASIAQRIVDNESLVPWLLQRATKKESKVSQNKQYSTEILAILLQTSPAIRLRFFALDGVDAFLQILSAYRKRDPEKGTEEEEFVENLFDCITCCVDDDEGKEKFLAAEGVELCLIMVKEGKMSRLRALRILDHLVGGNNGLAGCERLVEAGGLKTLFTVFMKKHDKESSEHLLGIFASMLRLLPAESAERIRLLGKFVEKEYEKIGRIIKLRQEYVTKLATVDRSIEAERATLPPGDQDDLADEWLSRRMDAGLSALQSMDIILAWLVAEDEGARAKVQEVLSSVGADLGSVKATLQEQLRLMSNQDSETENSVKEMITTLIGFCDDG
ncbi:hypothetical protein MMC25_004754 [Agyrium rufum]|nr:hypothetical protein [Agyrium rufum]